MVSFSPGQPAINQSMKPQNPLFCATSISDGNIYYTGFKGLLYKRPKENWVQAVCIVIRKKCGAVNLANYQPVMDEWVL